MSLGICLAWSPIPWLALFVSIPVGLGGAGFVASMNAITQQECPPVMRGRILALTAVAFLGLVPDRRPDHRHRRRRDQRAVVAVLRRDHHVGGHRRTRLVGLGRTAETSRFEALRKLLGASAAAAPNPGEHP